MTWRVTPFVGVWIETMWSWQTWWKKQVTPFVGVWIETASLKSVRWKTTVTPFVGVWIETRSPFRCYRAYPVTPFVGVWIETYAQQSHWSTQGSHPSWVCGLKRQRNETPRLSQRHTLRGCVDWNIWESTEKKRRLVTPFVGVWIETILLSQAHIRVRSHPSWVCGLKHPLHAHRWRHGLSHPSWVCGLKQGGNFQRVRGSRSHPSWVCGLKLPRHNIVVGLLGHTLRGCVDWNRKQILFSEPT